MDNFPERDASRAFSFFVTIFAFLAQTGVLTRQELLGGIRAHRNGQAGVHQSFHAMFCVEATTCDGTDQRALDFRVHVAIQSARL